MVAGCVSGRRRMVVAGSPDCGLGNRDFVGDFFFFFAGTFSLE